MQYKCQLERIPAYFGRVKRFAVFQQCLPPLEQHCLIGKLEGPESFSISGRAVFQQLDSIADSAACILTFLDITFCNILQTVFYCRQEIILVLNPFLILSSKGTQLTNDLINRCGSQKLHRQYISADHLGSFHLTEIERWKKSRLHPFGLDIIHIPHNRAAMPLRIAMHIRIQHIQFQKFRIGSKVCLPVYAGKNGCSVATGYSDNRLKCAAFGCRIHVVFRLVFIDQRNCNHTLTGIHNGMGIYLQLKSAG